MLGTPLRWGPMAAVSDLGTTASLGARRHNPALDGIRAVSVLAVLCFHGQMPWAQGGFLGVSVFFTLSGYLITSVVLDEHHETGRMDPLRFWARRFRRLAPASLALLAVLVVIGAIAGLSDRVASDIRAAALYVANWWSIHQGASYADIFANPSPTEHFWSLAIEEQFYAAFPLLAWVCLRGRTRREGQARFFAVLAAITLATIVAGLVMSNPDHIYLNTFTRMPELLVGALIAFLWPLWPQRRRPVPPLGTAAGVVALAVILGACARTTYSDTWLYQGGFPAFAFVSGALIMVATRPGPLAMWLAIRPLRRLGEISYGVYLFHWPVFLWLDQRRTGWSLGWLLVLRIVVTVVIAWASYRWLEEPIRRGRMLNAAQARRAFAVALCTVLVGTMAVPTRADEREGLLDALDGGGTELGLVGEPPPTTEAPSTTTSPGPSTSAATTTTAAPRFPMIALAGDSVPAVLANEIGPLATTLGTQILKLGIEGCDGARGYPNIRYGPGRTTVEDERCGRWEELWPPVLKAYPPDAVVFILGAAAVLDRRIDGAWRNACDPAFARWYSSELRARLDWAEQNTSATVMLATSPWAEYGTLGLPPNHQDRTDCLNAIFEQVLAERPEVVRIDLRAHVCPGGRRGCLPIRSDGLHYRGEGAAELARWLIPEILRHVPRDNQARVTVR
jgi:peptidoglycan/LPS O-acetylase OafA/YrhL